MYISKMDILEELNEAQRLAVTNIEGPMMIVAGPGSGKTRVLTYRMAYLLETGVDPFSILLLTFTNKAALEMRERIQKMVGPEARNLFMGTFHSVFARILRMEAHRLGYPKNFTIYDNTDSKNLLKDIIKEQGLDLKSYKPNNVYFKISSSKNSLIGPEEYQLNPEIKENDEAQGVPLVGKLYEKYQNRMFKAGAMDFDDLLMKTYILFDSFPDVLYKYQKRFVHLMIDEFQDTNNAQYSIVRQLADIHQNICVVGDDAQSIYAFRGATIANILNFEKDYTDLKVFKLEQNYRSTPFIVEAANQVIGKNHRQIKKVIWTDKSQGDKVKVFKASSENDEARLVAEQIVQLRTTEQVTYEDVAILYRTNPQSRALEEAFRRANIPYRIYGGLSFYQRKEVKDFVAYLRLLVNPNDEEALKRVLGLTKGVGQTTINKINVGANTENVSMWEMVLRPERIPQITKNAYSLLSKFAMMIQSFQIQLKEKNAYQIAEMVGRQTGMLDNLFLDKTDEGKKRYENVQELLSGIKSYTMEDKPELEEDEVELDSDLATYLQQISLLTDQDNEDDDPNKVKLMTIHASKGLEFPVVFVVGLEENIFPSMLSLNSLEEIEEERRLFYVAITRAESRLFLSYASTRFKFGTLQYNDVSRFIAEIGKENMDSDVYRSQHAAFSQRPLSRNRDNSNDNDVPWYMKKGSRRPRASDRVSAPTPNRSTSSKSSLAKVSSAAPKFIPSDLKKLRVGDTVVHEKFKKGLVQQLEGKGENIIGTIFFEQHGQKKIMLKFAKLQIITD